MYQLQISEIRPEPEPEPEPDSALAAPLLCMLMMCMKLRNLHTNCTVLMSVICCVVLLFFAQCNA